MHHKTALVITLSTALAALLSACGAPGMPPAPMYAQSALPPAVQVPSGFTVTLETVGVGEITYECRAKPGAADQHEWAFVGPSATLTDRQGRPIGRYFGPPATWAAADGSSITGRQMAVAPGGPGHLPLQLLQADPASGAGAMAGISHVQRVATRGGVAPATACNAAAQGQRAHVPYQADYIFWKPA
jgi:hypothetical protein